MRSGLARFVFTAFLFSFVLLLPAPSNATPVSGQLTMGGDATVGATFLTFLCDFITGDVCPANTGDFRVGGPAAQSGSFLPYANGHGYIQSLNQSAEPLNTNFLLSNFITFSPMDTPADIAFDLTFIFLGTSGQAQCGAPANPSQIPAQVCTPVIPSLVSASNPGGLSAFNLANTSTGSTASFNVKGKVRRISTGETSDFTGEFTAVFTSDPGTTDRSYQALLQTFANGGTITTGYSAQFKAVITPTGIPEPGTISLACGGLLILVGVAGRRRIRRRRTTL